MKKPIIFYLIVSFIILLFSILFLGFIPQQNLVYAQQCAVDSDCRPIFGNNYCCGSSVCNDILYQFCNPYSDPPDQCAPDFTNQRTHVDSCACGCSNGSCNSCAVCSAGATETNTELSCTNNPSICGGYSGRCDQYTTVYKRSCKSDGSGWNEWYIDNEYSQCPTDPDIDCGNCSVPATCGNGACDNGETCSSCQTDCGACPPGAKYRCSGSSCIRDDAGGTTSSSNCGGLCSAPAPGCPSATVSVSPNPVNINSPVTFSATSSHAYGNANVSHGGGAQGGDDFSITGSYTWSWAYDPGGASWGNSSSTAGTYNAVFSGDRPGGGSSCTFSTSYTVLGFAPTPTISPPGCILNGDNGSGIIISWASSTPAVSYVDISVGDNNFSPLYHKAVTGTSTNASGFGLTFNPGTTYYVRTWNGYQHNAAPNPSFSIPLCIPASPTGLTASCTGSGNTAALSWNPVTGATLPYQITVNGTTTTSGTSSISYSTTPGNTYPWSVSACNNAGCSVSTAADTPFTCALPACPGGFGACGDFLPSPASIDTCSNGTWVHNAGTALGYNIWCEKNANPTRGFCYRCDTTVSPWIQATGDVHSNESINAPGGP